MCDFQRFTGSRVQRFTVGRAIAHRERQRFNCPARPIRFSSYIQPIVEVPVYPRYAEHPGVGAKAMDES